MKAKKTQTITPARQELVPIKPAERRYRIQSDGDHEYFVEVGQEGQFNRWVQTFEDSELYDIYYEEGNMDYEDNRIDGRFTFTDPRNG